jgi:DNA-binding transcriptional LysR family regulator
VSKQVGHLEDRLGVRLLNRSTRALSLTEAGRTFHARCVGIAADIEEAQAQVSSMGKRPQGTLNVASTVAFGKAQLLPLCRQFLARYPDLRLSVQFTDRPIDLVAEEVDVAIRFTEQINNSSLVARKLAPNRRVICAAPAYIEAHGIPRTPEDLTHHNCLRLSTVAGWNEWAFEGKDGKWDMHAAGNFEANSADAVYHATLAGMGLARLSTYLIGDDLKAGRLVRVLPDYLSEGSNIFAIYAARRNLMPSIRAFIDHLTAHFGTVPPWERA